MAVPQISPESSLGNIGKSLLRFIKPALKVGPHRKITNVLDQEDLLDRDIHHSCAVLDEETSFQQSDSVGDEQDERERQMNGSRRDSIAVGLGSGVISVKRDSSTPWVNVVIDLADSCEKGSASARAKLGASLYQSANGSGSSLSKTSVGRMIDIVTIIQDDSVADTDDSDGNTSENKDQPKDTPESEPKKVNDKKSTFKKSA